MSILSALKQQTESLDDLAKLPQSMIMQMAQRKEIAQEMVPAILGRKAELMDSVARTQAMQSGAAQAPSVMEQIMQKNAQAEHPMQQPAPQMEDTGVAQLPVREPQYAGGGIIAFADGGDVGGSSYIGNLHPSVLQGLVEGRIPMADARWMSDYANTKGDTRVETGKGAFKDQSERMQNFVDRMRSGEIKTPPQFKETVGSSGSRVGGGGGAGTLPNDKSGLDRPHLYAGGGTAMADYDDEEDDYSQAIADEDHKSMLSRLYSTLGKGVKSFASGLTGDKSSGISSLIATERTGHPYEAEAIAAAKKVGLDPSIMLHALYKETGGLKDPATAKSKAGAYGPMQLMAGTAKELGVDRKDPYENILGGATYLKQQLDTFKDPKLALAAYNAGPGAVKRALSGSQGIAALPRETQGYMKMASGGIVPGYAAGDYIDPASTLSPGEEIMNLPPEKRDLFEEWMRRNAASREELKKSAVEDRNLALLQAGLGIMGGTSPYAMANIGAGAMQGAQAYGASKRARGQEQMMLDKMEIGALGAKTKQEGLEEYRKARLDEQKENRLRLGQQSTDANEQKALRNAALDPDYKKFSTSLENISDPTDPMYDYYVTEMRKIQNAYLTGKPYVRGNPPVKIKEPGIWDRIKGGFSSLPVEKPTGVDSSNPLLK